MDASTRCMQRARFSGFLGRRYRGGQGQGKSHSSGPDPRGSSAPCSTPRRRRAAAGSVRAATTRTLPRSLDTGSCGGIGIVDGVWCADAKVAGLWCPRLEWRRARCGGATVGTRRDGPALAASALLVLERLSSEGRVEPLGERVVGRVSGRARRPGHASGAAGAGACLVRVPGVVADMQDDPGEAGAGPLGRSRNTDGGSGPHATCVQPAGWCGRRSAVAAGCRNFPSVGERYAMSPAYLLFGSFAAQPCPARPVVSVTGGAERVPRCLRHRRRPASPGLGRDG